MSQPVNYDTAAAGEVRAALAQVAMKLDDLHRLRADLNNTRLNTWRGAHRDDFAAKFPGQQNDLSATADQLRRYLGRIDAADAQARAVRRMDSVP
jgi:hypothetical protein